MKVEGHRASQIRTEGFLYFLLLFSFLLLQASSFAADVPAAINYQGVLMDNQGNPAAAGDYRVAFRIWDDPTAKGAGNLIWGREFALNVLGGGRFNVLLTDGGDEVADPVPQTNDLRQAFEGENRHLGLTVTETPSGAVSDPSEIPTRQQLVSAPYAIRSVNATDAKQASDGFHVENGLLVDSGGIDVTGSATLHNTLEVDEAATLDSPLHVHDTLTTYGAALYSLHVGAGGAQFDSSMVVDGPLAVAPPATLAGYGTVPVGGLVMWNGPTNTIPDGWALCDGRTVNGYVTPNLLDRFLVGAGDDYGVGATGGEDTHELSESEMPWHHHSYSTKGSIYGYHGVEDSGDFWKHTDDNSRTTGTRGNNMAHENRPPYHALYFIMRVQ